MYLLYRLDDALDLTRYGPVPQQRADRHMIGALSLLQIR
jgi:hypothetical protein